MSDELVICTKFRDIPLEYDLMVVYWWTYALYPVVHARLTLRPVIITGAYNFSLPKFFGAVDYIGRPWYQKLLIALATRFATLNLVNSKFEKNQIESHFGIRNCDVSYLSYPDSMLSPVERCPSLRLQILEDNGTLDRFIFNICWLQESNLLRKGVVELIEAFGKLNSVRDKSDLPFLICAGREGDGARLFNELAVRFKVEKQIIHLGTISEGEKYYLMQRCHVYAQPSRYEGFGLATLEAAVSGAKVLASDVGAVKEILGESAVYVDPNNIEELASLLAQYIYEPKGEITAAIYGLREKFSEINFSRRIAHFIGCVIR
jgi:glycosyltransferase involved in cell wall biosynthesis